ncbi:MAG: ATP-binding protein [Desulfatibacillaceae bacterium]|nr:ATP-binding protein [Desulfatibacillaceae bacterium]
MDIKSYQTIRRAIFTIIILVSLTPLLTLISVTAFGFHTAYRSKVMAYLDQLVEKHALNIDTFLFEKLANIRVLALSHSMDELSDAELLNQLLASLQEGHNDVFVDLGLVNEQGIQVAYAGPFKLGRADYSDAIWFKEALQNRVYISDVFMGLRGLPHFIVAVKKRVGDERYILRSTIDFGAFNRLVENTRMGQTGFAFIINRDAALQTHSREDISAFIHMLGKRLWGQEPNQVTPGNNDEDSWAAFAAQRALAQRPVYHFTGKNAVTGKPAIFVNTFLKNNEWALVYVQDKADAFASLYAARNLSLLVLLIGGIAIVIMASILSKRVSDRIRTMDLEKQMMNEKVIEAGKLASVGELAAGIAHEINNPVAIMVEESGWIGDLLEEDEFKNTENLAEIRRALTQIQTQGSRCKAITHKLLSFARKTDPMERDVDINSLIMEVVEMSRQQARYANVRINTNLSDNLSPVTVSPSEMQQVLLNLINNALDAMDKKEGGLLSISTRMEEGFVKVDVSDTGSGIPDANLKRIFDPFFTTKPVGKGTGLGLSIVHGIMEKMGGKISVNSAVGVGTTFHLYLPVTPKGTDERP